MQRAVFLDRDGTMIHDIGYLSRRDDLRWFPWTIDAIRLLNRAGFAVCVTSNQGGIGLGYTTETFVRALHEEMAQTIAAAGGRVDGWYYCPHHPRATADALRIDCTCRKPKPGMIDRAVADLDLDVRRSFVIGDKLADVGLGVAAGATSVLVQTGYGDGIARAHGGSVPGAAHVAPTLLEAVSWIVNG